MNRSRASWLVALIMCVALLPGCAAQASFTYEADAGSWTAETLSEAIAGVDRPPYVGEPVSKATEHRHDALVDLRKQGDEPALLADLLTESFPSESRAVPFWGAPATVEGREAWIVAEVWGLEDGSLDNLRVWAFDRASGDIIASSASK